MIKRLLTNSLIFFAGNIFLSIFNYLYNTFMGRYLGPANYSILGSLLAFIAIITIPTNAISTVMMRFTAHYHSQGKDGQVHGFFRGLTRKLLPIGIAVSLLIALLAKPLANFLHLPSIIPVILVSPVILFAILLPINRGVLQGLQRFMDTITNQSIDPILKLIIGVVLVRLGMQINGAITAIIIAAFVAYLMSFIPLRAITRAKPEETKELPADVKQFSAVALVAFLMATILMNIDILLVKHYMPAHDAGLYNALSNIGKIILFVTSPVIGVMFPMISDLQGRQEKHYKILMLSFILVTAIGICGVVGYYLLPNLAVNILYGSAYQSIAPLLGVFAVVMLLYSLINLWINYFLSIGDTLFLLPLGVAMVTEIITLVLRHQSFNQVISGLMLSMIVGFVLLTCYYLFLKRKQLVEVLPTFLSTQSSA